jgi:hypothetical protein
MSATCKVDNTALEKCTQGYQDFLKVVRSRESERIRRDNLLQKWTVSHARWKYAHRTQLNMRDAGRGTNSDQIWDKNIKWNCSTGTKAE